MAASVELMLERRRRNRAEVRPARDQIALTMGVFAEATARTSCSSENGSRSSTLPPPRSDHDDVDLGIASSSPQGLGDGGGSRLSLNCDSGGVRTDAWPAPHSILNDVTFGSCRAHK